MATENVNIPQQHADFIRELIATGQYQDLDEVFRVSVHLLKERVAQERTAKEKLRAMLDKAFAGGVVDESFDEIWDAAEARYIAKNA